ncbi:potassium-transporting ATPase subunit F [Methyloversatilis thermotolerans]|nr:potassium-transporting ATPase subunit F [Methyloversatilis thermotolerans]
MNTLYLICGALAVALGLYLIHALWHAEDF